MTDDSTVERKTETKALHGVTPAPEKKKPRTVSGRSFLPGYRTRSVIGSSRTESVGVAGQFPSCPLFSSSKLSARVALSSLCWPSIGPLQDGVKRRTKGLAPWCQTVFNLRWHLGIGRPHNDSVRRQPAELLPQHLLSDVRYRSFQVGEAHHLASE